MLGAGSASGRCMSSPTSVATTPDVPPLALMARRSVEIATDQSAAAPRRVKSVPFALVPAVTVTVILLGALEQYGFGRPQFAHGLWLIGLIGAGFPVVWRTARSVLNGKFNTDLVASLSIITAAIIG